MGDLSRLDAVNHMLLMAGESLVSDLENNSGLDTETAEFVLDQFTRDFQMRGVANNRFIKKTKLTSDGKVALPADSMSVELLSNHTNSDNYNITGIARGTGTDRYLWNVTDQTDQWDKDVEYTYEVILTLGWDDMDTPVQRAILSAGARQYQMVTQGDADADKYLNGLEVFYTAKGRGADLDDKRRNIFTASTGKMNEARDRGGMRSNNLRYWRTTNG